MGTDQAREGSGLQQMLEGAAGRVCGDLRHQEPVFALWVSVPGGRLCRLNPLGRDSRLEVNSISG